VRDLLVLWDVDYTLLDAGGNGRAVYRAVFRDLFGRDPDEVAPMGGRTERAIIADTLSMAGIGDPARHVDAFIAELTRRAPELRATIAASGRALPGAAAALAAVAALGPAVVQSVLTGNVPAMARAKLAAFGLDAHLDLAVGAYGDHHEVRAELVHLARGRASAAYGREFGGDGDGAGRRHPAGCGGRARHRGAGGRRGHRGPERRRAGGRWRRRGAARPHRYRRRRRGHHQRGRAFPLTAWPGRSAGPVRGGWPGGRWPASTARSSAASAVTTVCGLVPWRRRTATSRTRSPVISRQIRKPGKSSCSAASSRWEPGQSSLWLTAGTRARRAPR
jgi:phosphoglycolate phosphatase-like HAD superfamily hydrolase